MKDKIISMFMNRPSWFNHEGYWRILVIVRFLLFVPILLWGSILAVRGIYNTVTDSYIGVEWIYAGIFLIVTSFVLVILLNLLLRVVGWVVAGFTESK
ncbi:hypothetical protein ACCC84_21950 [Serratia odorifera]|uniref:hypothetical protein n=1 Tax=Serratia odorifera TaxID=618 RepID=UPI003531E8A2